MDESTIMIDSKVFRRYRDTKYYCDEFGNIYSLYSHQLLNPMVRGKGNKKYLYIDVNDDHRQHHVYIHRIVFETWVGSIPDNLSVLHKDDNQFNNHWSNLCLGTQKENIEDCFNNGNRVGHTKILVVYDSQANKTLTFSPASRFIDYCGHSSNSGSIAKFFSKQWFKQRYTVLSYRTCKSLQEKEGVTTNEG